ncbi:MAG: Response regulator receiver protein [Candidatus Magnetoglobus multicellularis str. Araruama]|uniref:Response regulator receiver protein n=1 Tax=Candidatus Magnetoglobus multicellularis str. Araruama TaxID=890399 RepID=A0A1V1PE15_9BACT|nr:MAG: Response regulator receiver protein [Candidatus Magnetoglobus multicellularis str. Araruama]
MVRLIVKDYLQMAGFDVYEFDNPIDAIAAIKKSPCEIAIVDINMPEMPGETFMQKARQVCGSIQFIIHTGAIDYKVPSSLKDLGISQKNVLVKPIEDMNEFQTVIKRLLHTNK